MSENEINENITERGFFSKLSNGDFGLAKTFWLYGIVVSAVAGIMARLITSVELLIITSLLFIAYKILVLKGVWKAASKHQGAKIWTVLAKTVVVFSIIMLIFNVLALLVLLDALVKYS